MRIRLESGFSLIACCSLLLAGIAIAAQEPETQDVSGTWSLELVLPNGDTFTGTLSLHQEVDQITGTWQREGAKEQPRVRGEIKGKAITFAWISPIQRNNA